MDRIDPFCPLDLADYCRVLDYYCDDLGIGNAASETKGGGGNHEWVGVIRVAPLGCLADFPRRGAARCVPLTG